MGAEMIESSAADGGGGGREMAARRARMAGLAAEREQALLALRRAKVEAEHTRSVQSTPAAPSVFRSADRPRAKSPTAERFSAKLKDEADSKVSEAWVTPAQRAVLQERQAEELRRSAAQRRDALVHAQRLRQQRRLLGDEAMADEAERLALEADGPAALITASAVGGARPVLSSALHRSLHAGGAASGAAPTPSISASAAANVSATPAIPATASSLPVPRELFEQMSAARSQRTGTIGSVSELMTPAAADVPGTPAELARSEMLKDVAAAAAAAGMTPEEAMAALSPDPHTLNPKGGRSHKKHRSSKKSAAKREIRSAVQKELRAAMTPGMTPGAGVPMSMGGAVVPMGTPYGDFAAQRAALRAEIQDVAREERALAAEVRLGDGYGRRGSLAPPSAARDTAEVDVLREMTARAAQREDDLQRHLEGELAASRASNAALLCENKAAGDDLAKLRADLAAAQKAAEEVDARNAAVVEELRQSAAEEAAVLNASAAAAERKAQGAAELRAELVALQTLSEREVFELRARCEAAESDAATKGEQLEAKEAALKAAAAWADRGAEVERLTTMNARLAAVNRDLVADKEGAEQQAASHGKAAAVEANSAAEAGKRAAALEEELAVARLEAAGLAEKVRALEAHNALLVGRVSREEDAARHGAELSATREQVASAEHRLAGEQLARAKDRARVAELESELKDANAAAADRAKIASEVAVYKELVMALEGERKELGGRVKVLVAQVEAMDSVKAEVTRLQTLNDVLRRAVPDGSAVAMQYDQALLASVGADTDALQAGNPNENATPLRLRGVPLAELPSNANAGSAPAEAPSKAPATPSRSVVAARAAVAAATAAGDVNSSASDAVRSLAALVSLPLDLLRAHRSEVMMGAVRSAGGGHVRFSDMMGVSGGGSGGVKRAMRRVVLSESHLLVFPRPDEAGGAGGDGAPLVGPLRLAAVRAVRWHADGAAGGGSGGGDIELSVDGLGSVLRLETPRRAEVLGALAALLLELPLALTIKAEGHARALVATPVAD